MTPPMAFYVCIGEAWQQFATFAEAQAAANAARKQGHHALVIAAPARRKLVTVED